MAINLHGSDWTLREIVAQHADMEEQRNALAKRVDELWVKAACLDDIISRFRRGGVTLVEVVQVIDAKVGMFSEVSR